MGWNKGTLRQKFKVEVDISKLLEYVTDSVLGAVNDIDDVNSVDFDESYVDDTDLIIYGSYDADYESCFFDATRYEPAEYDCERPWIGDEGVGLLDSVPENIRKLVNISRVTEDEDECDYKDNAPDYEDRAYDEWKERNFDR